MLEVTLRFYLYNDIINAIIYTSALLTQEAACQSQSEGPEFEPQKGQITLLGLP